MKEDVEALRAIVADMAKAVRERVEAKELEEIRERIELGDVVDDAEQAHVTLDALLHYRASRAAKGLTRCFDAYLEEATARGIRPSEEFLEQVRPWLLQGITAENRNAVAAIKRQITTMSPEARSTQADALRRWQTAMAALATILRRHLDDRMRSESSQLQLHRRIAARHKIRPKAGRPRKVGPEFADAAAPLWKSARRVNGDVRFDELRKVARNLDVATAGMPNAHFKKVLSDASLTDIRRHNQKENKDPERQIVSYESAVRYGSPRVIADLRRKLTDANLFAS
jgi:hypothetical protein